MYLVILFHWLFSTVNPSLESTSSFKKSTTDSLVAIIDNDAVKPFRTDEHQIKPEYHHTVHKTFTTIYFKDEQFNYTNKIVHMESHEDYRVTTYYFHKKNLILIKVLERVQKSPATPITGNYYYESNALVYKEELNGKPSVNPSSLANTARELNK
ncbi:MAG: hypothetical protein U0U66_06965 [Cytophagaceae bacterium]